MSTCNHSSEGACDACFPGGSMIYGNPLPPMRIVNPNNPMTCEVAHDMKFSCLHCSFTITIGDYLRAKKVVEAAMARLRASLEYDRRPRDIRGEAFEDKIVRIDKLYADVVATQRAEDAALREFEEGR